MNINDIEEVDGLDGDGLVALFVRGEHDLKIFAQTCGNYMEDNYGEDCPIKNVRSEYWRNIPLEDRTQYKKAVKNKQGAFLVTVADLREWKL